MQLGINDANTIIFEWIPYTQFNNIKKIDEGGFSTIYFARWNNGPLFKNSLNDYERLQNKEVILKCLHKPQDNDDNIVKFLNEV
jgi:serine/threonine protein kinase